MDEWMDMTCLSIDKTEGGGWHTFERKTGNV